MLTHAMGALALLAAGLGLLAAVPLPAQVLARPGWAGSGVAVEPWWHRAVFYRIDVARFQDGTGAGCGNLAGVTQRLDYLQSLGVDAIVLAPGFDRPPAQSASVAAEPGSGPTSLHPCGAQAGTASPGSAEGLDDLARQAASHHLRVLIELDAPASQSSDAMGRYLAQVRAWLNQGAAGFYLRTPQLAALKDPNLAAYLVRQLRSLARSVPGERILLADQAPDAGSLLGRTIAHEAQLVVDPALSFVNPNAAAPTAASLRQQLLAGLSSSSSLTSVLRFSRQLPDLSAQQQQGLERAAAAMLLASRTAVLVDFGQELGEQPANGPHSAQEMAVGPGLVSDAPLMQWTPTNLTRDPKPAAVETAAANSSPAYGTYHAYVKPLPRTLFPPPPLPNVVLSDTPPPVAPDSLPGFTSGDIDPALAARVTANASTINVAVEDADPGSLLNLYRRLIQLHHQNASVRNGSEDVLNFDGVDALVWLRRAPAGSRTSATVVVACNLSAQPFALPVSVVGSTHTRRTRMRNLLSVAAPQLASQAQPARETGDSLTVAAGQLFIGELQP